MVLELWCKRRKANLRKELLGKELRIRWWKLMGENEKLILRKLKEGVVWNMEGNIN